MRVKLVYKAGATCLLWLLAVASVKAADGTGIEQDNAGEKCARQCEAGVQRICHFRFVMEYYQAMGVACDNCAAGNASACNNLQCVLGDGFEKGVMSINRQVPGPAIHVCRDDLIIVDVVNQAAGTAVTLHWHGMHMRSTPFMDGVPFVTQCPISFGNAFRYSFVATEAGTHWYHSHAGHHRVNGQYGMLIVREPQPTHSQLYDFDLPEQHLLLADWLHPYAEKFVPGLPSTMLAADALNINGRGSYIDPKWRVRQVKVPPTMFELQPDKRHLFRVVHAGSTTCPFRVQVQQHMMSIIASDGFAVQPRSFDTFFINSGERYDFVLHANNTPGDYWLRVTGVGTCENMPIESLALLRYRQAKPPARMPKQLAFKFQNKKQFPMLNTLNDPKQGCEPLTSPCINSLMSMEEDNELLTATPSHTFYLAFDNHAVAKEQLFRQHHYMHFLNLVGSRTFIGGINNLSLVFPPQPPLTQSELIDESVYCNASQRPAHCADQPLCPCVHRLQVPLNSIVQFVIVDEVANIGPVHHPFHLHGFRFMVMALARHPQGVPMTLGLARSMAAQNLLLHSARTLDGGFNPKPPFKDTVSIPSRGYAVVRFRANNPGFWLMHCHFEWHAAIGMGLILQVGDVPQMVKAPANFPHCGNYQPPIARPQ